MAGLPVGTNCADGEVCRGDECVAEFCASSASCDAAAPYCTGQTCVETCTTDAECPGFGQDVADAFCLAGTCVACRTDHDDCPASAPVCDANMCRACAVDADCPSQVCDAAFGTCVDEATILYVSPGGGNTADCSQATPCSVSRGLASLDPTHTTIRLLDGSYPVGFQFPSGAIANVVGPGATLTGFVTGGNVIAIVENSAISIRGVTIDASGAVPVHCDGTAGVSTVILQGIHQLSYGAELLSLNCNTTVSSSLLLSFIGAKGAGTITIDQTSFTGLETQFGSHLVVDVQNSVMLEGVSMNSAAQQMTDPVTGRVAFSTFVLPSYALCNGQLNFENDIFYSTGNYGYSISHGSTCTSSFDHNLAFPQDAPIGNGMLIGDPKFVNLAAGDYHLMLGSPAIDAANPAASDAVDFDGVSRPQGNNRDLGAFEFH